MADTPVAGACDPAWSVVRDAFTDNFAAIDDDPGDLGAALCVMAGGRVVVDLWGGWTDSTRATPWTPDTLVNAYSVGKGVSAAVALAAVSRGLIDLDEPLQLWWPELGAATTLRQVLSHRAGLPALREDAAEHLPLVWHESSSVSPTPTSFVARRSISGRAAVPARPTCRPRRSDPRSRR